MSKIVLDELNTASGVPRQHLQFLLGIVTSEVEQYKLEAGTIISIGDYGHIRLDVDQDDQSRDKLYLLDVGAGSKNAKDFVSRFIAQKGFEHMENEAWSEALDCFDFSLDIRPNNAVLLQARASVKEEIIRLPKTSPEEGGHLILGVLDDLLRSVELAPDRAEVYGDLLYVLKSFRPVEGITEEHRQWLSKVVEQVLSHTTKDPDAIREREALLEYASSAG